MKYPYNPTPEQKQQYRNEIDDCLVRWVVGKFKKKIEVDLFFDKLAKNTGLKYSQNIRARCRQLAVKQRA